jgi:hypothetical protein
MKALRVGPAVLAATLTACAAGAWLPPDIGDDAWDAHARLCGFPAGQLVDGGDRRIGHLRVGQQVTITLEGYTDRVRAVVWSAHERFTDRSRLTTLVSTSRLTATLTGIAPSVSSPSDDVLVGAKVVFRDDSEVDLRLLVCQFDRETRVDYILVEP